RHWNVQTVQSIGASDHVLLGEASHHGDGQADHFADLMQHETLALNSGYQKFELLSISVVHHERARTVEGHDVAARTGVSRLLLCCEVVEVVGANERLEQSVKLRHSLIGHL